MTKTQRRKMRKAIRRKGFGLTTRGKDAVFMFWTPIGLVIRPLSRRQETVAPCGRAVPDISVVKQTKDGFAQAIHRAAARARGHDLVLLRLDVGA